MVQTVVHRAYAEDAQIIAHIINEAWKQAYAGIVPKGYLDALDETEKAERLREGLTRFANMRYYLLEADGIPVGAASLHPTRDADLPNTAEFSFFYFLPAAWRQGYGKKLLTLLKGEAASLGYRRLCCWVLGQNRRAVLFYESQGMLRDGARQTVTIEVPLEAVRFICEL